MFKRLFGTPAEKVVGQPAVPSRPMATDLHEALARLVPRWSREGADLLPPATAADVHAVFERVGAVATPDVVALYTTIGGVQVMDDALLRIWSLEEIAAKGPGGEGVIFADYLISSGDYRLVTSAGSCSAVLLDRDECRIGPTLEAFLIWLEADPEFVHWYW